jgi:hypothetical protein
MLGFNMGIKANVGGLFIDSKNNALIDNEVFKRGILCKGQHLLVFIRLADY